MATLLLRNQNPDAVLQQVKVDVESGVWVTEEDQPVTRRALQTKHAFTHPFLNEKALKPTSSGQYVYTYRNHLEFLLALRYVYATLLKSENPTECSILIQPDPEYLVEETRFELYCSCNAKKAATHRLTTRQIGAMFSEIYGSPFEYGNKIILDKTVTYLDLPESLDADTLYEEPSIDVAWFRHQTCLDKYELRYINHHLGFGVFARTHIPKGELIALYNGHLVSTETEYKNYCYYQAKNKSFNLLIDASHYGNLARFINHAPTLEECKVDKKVFLCANVEVEHHNWYGADHIMYIADRDIACGEQILSSYGEAYFGSMMQQLHIKKNGTVLDEKHRRIQDTTVQKRAVLQILARYGNQQARWLLLRKPTITLLLCIMLGLIMQYK